MQYEDRLALETPEGVALELTLAGIGSRFTAAIVDSLIQSALFIALLIIVAVTASRGDNPAPLAIAAFALGWFLVFFGYHVLFEVLASGRTPGKRLVGLRVVRVGGGPVTFLTSVTRNLLRLVDMLPTAYAVGIISILASSRNQRLGDMAAGTLVVVERPATHASFTARAVAPPADPAAFEGWDVSTVTVEEVAAVRSFLARRWDLTPDARRALAWELSSRLRPKVVTPVQEPHPELFLELLAAAKAARS